jgi:hypothetical protein
VVAFQIESPWLVFSSSNSKSYQTSCLALLWSA